MVGEGGGGEGGVGGKVGQMLGYKYHIQKLDIGNLLVGRYKLRPCLIPERGLLRKKINGVLIDLESL